MSKLRKNHNLAKHITSVILLLVGWWGPPELGLASSDSADFLRMTIPAASAGQAAGVALRGGSNALHWNPAGILGQVYPSIGVTHYMSFADTAYQQMDLLYPYWLQGHWQAKLFFAKTYDFFETNSLGETIDKIENADILLQLTYARYWGQGLSAGMSTKVFYSTLAGYARQGAALDIGCHYQLFNKLLNFGLAAQHLGIMSAFDQHQENLPMMMVGGMGLQLAPLTGQRLRLAADYNLPIQTTNQGYLTFGLDYQPWPFINMRSGYRLNSQALGKMSFGVGLKILNVGVDYAFQPYAELGNSHRVTLTYHFEPKPITPPKGPKSVKLEPKFDAANLSSAKNLSRPRLMKGNYEFFVPQINNQVKAWTFEVRDQKGRLVRKYVSHQQKPKSFIWDGRDEQGRPVPKRVNYQFVLKADNETKQTTKLPKVAPVLKLWFDDETDVAADVAWYFYQQPPIRQWQLTIMTRGSNKIIRRLTGNKNLPDQVIWDGKNDKGVVAKTSDYYAYQLNLTYPDGQTLTIEENIEAVKAKTVAAPLGTIGILIYGILFDFNRTKMKPIMENKVIMAGQLLKKYPQGNAVCEGMADRVGSDTYNWNLSRRRANDVAFFLKQQSGVEKKQVEIVGYGEKKLWSKESGEKSRTLNRRVDIKLLFPVETLTHQRKK